MFCKIVSLNPFTFGCNGLDRGSYYFVLNVMILDQHYTHIVFNKKKKKPQKQQLIIDFENGVVVKIYKS